MTALNIAAASSSSSHHGSDDKVTRYVVQSTDVLQDMRINISEEGSETVTWYKERFLSDDEIIDHVVHNPTSTICWSIHRPSRRGWYIRIRSPSFAPGAFIPFIPLPRMSPHYVDAALSFNSRTNRLWSPEANSEERPSLSSLHSYPPSPTPPPLSALPPSPSAVRAKLEEVDIKQDPTKSTSQITQFVLAPHAPEVAQPTTTSIFSRALNALRNSRPANSSSFTLCRIPNAAPPCSPPPYASVTSVLETANLSSTLASSALPPVLTFHDRTPLLTVRSLTGIIEIEKTEEKALGIDTGFWIAVALTYLDFLEERESYLAALND